MPVIVSYFMLILVLFWLHCPPRYGPASTQAP